MTDREKAIKTLEDIIATAEGIKGLSDDAGITISLDKIDSLRFGLESLKTDASDKTDRGEAIATLTEHLNHWKRLLSEGICTKDEGERTINALTFAIESIKVDRAYDLMYEKGAGMNEREYINAVLDEIKEKIIDYHEIGCDLNCTNCKMIACIEPKDVIADLEIIDKYRKE